MIKTTEEILQEELVASNTAITTLVTHATMLAEALRTSMENSLVIIRKSQAIYQQHVDYMQTLDDIMQAGEADDSIEDSPEPAT